MSAGAGVDERPGLPAAGQSDRRWRHLSLTLLLLLAIGLPMWVVYGFASGSISLLGNCGPQGYIGQMGEFAGGSAATLPTAAAIGGALWATAGVAVWLRQRTAAVVYGFVILYSVALVVLALAIGPAVWGPRHCVIG